MAGITRIIASLVPALALAGCAPKFDYVGSWSGNRDLPPGSNPVVAAQLSQIKLDITNQAQFTLREGGMPKIGQVRYEPDAAYLVIERVAGAWVQDSDDKSNFPDIQLTPTADGGLLFSNPVEFSGKPVTLKRDATPRPTRP